jgi:hypothetical protein
MSITSNSPLQINQLPSSLEIPRDFEKFREMGSLLFMRIVDAVNKKTGSLYYLQEIGNFQSFYTSGEPYVFRNGYRRVFDLVSLNGGTIAGGSSVTFAHGITGFVQGSLIYVTATASTGLSFTCTYPDASMDVTNIYFTNPLPSTGIVAAMFVAEYLKTD